MDSIKPRIDFLLHDYAMLWPIPTYVGMYLHFTDQTHASRPPEYQ